MTANADARSVESQMNEDRAHRFLDVVPGKVRAIYHDPRLEPEEYQSNPLILALPPFHKKFEHAKEVRKLHEVHHDDACRSWSKELKLLAISRIGRNGIVLPVQPRIAEWVHINMRAHLHSLQRLQDPDIIQKNYARIQEGGAGILDPYNPVHSASLLLTGISGVGKTTNVVLSLSQFPRIIMHENFNGKPFRDAQIVWMPIICPHNGSVGAACREALAWVDGNLGTHYLREMRPSANSADYVAKLSRVLRHHNTGMLVIDEIQNCLRAADQHEMLDLLVNLMNFNPCLVLAIGTPETASLITKKFRLARRFANRVITLEPFRRGANAKNAREKERYLDSLTRLDFLPTPFKEKDKIHAALLKAGAGVPAFITISWTLAQQAGIVAGKEMMTPQLVTAATKEAFSMVSGLLDALETRNMKKLSQIADMAIAEVREMVERLTSDHVQGDALSAHADQARFEVFYHAVSMLMKLGQGKGPAELAVATIQREAPEASLAEVIRLALDRLRTPVFETQGTDLAEAQTSGDEDKAAVKSKEGLQVTPEADAASQSASDSLRKAGISNFRHRNQSTTQSPNPAPEKSGSTAGTPFDTVLHPASAEEIPA
jgi:hypothetical protein